MQLSDYQNYHKGETIVVCGCGHSLTQLSNPKKFTTIGVNDVGRQFDPDYLVVLNPRTQFKNDRFKFVENSRAKTIFTQLNLGIQHANIVRFKLGARGGCDYSSGTNLPYTRNSPYVALCLAAYMGAKRIGLIGVDFTDHHFFAKSGRHILSRQITAINKEYQTLSAALSEQGVEVVNLSERSLLTSFPKQTVKHFELNCRATDSAPKPHNRPVKENSQMKVQIERYRGHLIGGFFDQLARTTRTLGHTVERRIVPFKTHQQALAIVWNGRRYRSAKNTIYCEHGWLPRDAYQVSTKGINADSHIAPFVWNGGSLADSERDAVANHLASLKSQNDFAQTYTSTTEPVAENVPEAFLLVPLQIESDTNIVRHVSPNLRKMQALIDMVSQSNPPFPIIFKQHPADQKRNQHLRLKVRRQCDSLRSHDQGNIHQILKSGCCKGIISLNSNVVHDGFLWDVPSIVLGRNIWPTTGPSPFLSSLPRKWADLDAFYSKESTTHCRESYLHYLLTHQWTLDDASDGEKVAELLDRKIFEINNSKKLINLATVRRRVKRKSSYCDPREKRINVFARNRGWLFEDLKQHFSNLSVPGTKVITTDRPIKNADAWISLRANEAINSPDKSRTLVQIHDLFDDDLYQQGGSRRVLNRCGALCFTHAEQQLIAERSGIGFNDKKVLLKPLGALSSFKPSAKIPSQFTVGWIGRPVVHNGEDFKQAHWLVEALTLLNHKNLVSVQLIGEKLNAIKAAISEVGFSNSYLERGELSYDQYPDEYRKLNCVIITSKFAAGPNCLFEALSSGVPVISTRCGWSDKLIEQGVNGYLVESPMEIATAIQAIYNDRVRWFQRRHEISALCSGLSLESWLEENIVIATSLISPSKVQTEAASKLPSVS